MKFGLYSLRWRNAKTPFKWTPPFLAVDDATALNALIEMSTKCPDLQNKYLCKVGEFDPSTGCVRGFKKPIVVHVCKKGKKDVSH